MRRSCISLILDRNQNVVKTWERIIQLKQQLDACGDSEETLARCPDGSWQPLSFVGIRHQSGWYTPCEPLRYEYRLLRKIREFWVMPCLNVPLLPPLPTPLVPTPVSDTRINVSKLPHTKILNKDSAVKSLAFCFKDLCGKLAKLGLEKIKPGTMKIRESSHWKFLYNLVLE